MITVFGRPVGQKALTIAAIAAGAAATLGIIQASSNADSTSSVPPSCTTPANQAGLSMTATEQCLEEATNWCAANHPEDGSGLCLDKVYGTVPSNY